jgi:hypothetical protein
VWNAEKLHAQVHTYLRIGKSAIGSSLFAFAAVVTAAFAFLLSRKGSAAARSNNVRRFLSLASFFEAAQRVMWATRSYRDEEDGMEMVKAVVLERRYASSAVDWIFMMAMIEI